MPDAGIRMILTGGYSPDAYNPASPNFIIMQSPLTMNDSLAPKAVSIITHEYVREIPEAKTINYMVGIWLQQKIKDQQADDVLYQSNGYVSEFPRCNFFIVAQDNTIITPAKKALKGVTRKRVMECASSKYLVKEAPVSVQDILKAKEAFLTSSTKRIQSVVKMDGHIIGDGKPGEITTSLLAMLIQEEQNYITKRS
jgi:D-alanine transaminase/branched-chain amino acid aminotransferase